MIYNDQPLLSRNNCLKLLTLMVCFALSCKHVKDRKYKSPLGYDLENPIVFKLPLELDEISGIAFYKKDTSILAINDEFGMLYKIYLNRPKQLQKWKFMDGADFEDLVLLDSIFYVLKSNGDLITFTFSGDSILLVENKFPIGTGNEFEILYYDSIFHKLMLICKDCEIDKKKSLSTYSYDPWSVEYASDSFKIDVQKIASLAGEEKMKFKPSAAGIHPITGELYIISSVNKLLVIADRVGNAKQVYKIDPGTFKQPEGLSFTPRGTMIISNESADVGVANLMVFPYRHQEQKVEQE
jgi:hypothetical protein